MNFELYDKSPNPVAVEEGAAGERERLHLGIGGRSFRQTAALRSERASGARPSFHLHAAAVGIRWKTGMGMEMENVIYIP